MESSHDARLELLADTWRSAEYPIPAAATLAATIGVRARGGTRRMVAVLLVEIGITVGVFALMIAAHRSGPGIPAAGWAFGLGHTALVWGFALWFRRGTWRPLTADTASYLALLRRRADRRRAAARFTLGLVAVELLGGGAALVALDVTPTAWVRANAPIAGLFAAILVAVAVTAWWTDRHAGRVRIWLDRMEAGLDGAR